MDNNDNLKKTVAEALLKIKAVFLRPDEPFTWASGIKSPIYCDNRLTLGYPEIRNIIEDGIAETVKKNYPNAEVLMGTSTAGIPHAALAAERLSLPMGYVRSDNKTHGRNNRIEGADCKGKKTVVIEDLISTGGSSVEVVEALREAGAEVLGIVSVFSYGLTKGLERLKDANVENHSLTDLDELIAFALDKRYITERESRMLFAFRANTSDESWRNVD